MQNRFTPCFSPTSQKRPGIGPRRARRVFVVSTECLHVAAVTRRQPAVVCSIPLGLPVDAEVYRMNSESPASTHSIPQWRSMSEEPVAPLRPRGRSREDHVTTVA